MLDDIVVEDIEALRLGAGIEDVRLASAIRALARGDLVRLTFRRPDDPGMGETLAVRITSRKGLRFRGKLVGRPKSASLAKLQVGAALTFTAAQIHSIRNNS